MQRDLEDVQLRLTDHVLLGTDEEAERMAKAVGPDGERLRTLRREKAELTVRQRQQKAVLISVARRAVEATAKQEMAQTVRPSAAGMGACTCSAAGIWGSRTFERVATRANGSAYVCVHLGRLGNLGTWARGC